MAVSSDLYANLSILYENKNQVRFLQPQAYVEGCLTGACACPEIPLPDVWLPWVIKHHQQIQNAEQADHITNVLFDFFKQCLANMHSNTLSLPTYATYDANASDDNKDLSDWCQGILLAHSAREEVWQAAWNKMQAKSPATAPVLAKDLKHCLLMFTTFAHPEEAIKEANHKDGSGQTLANKLPHIAKSLPDALIKYVAISGELAAYLPNQFETFEKKTN